MADDGTTPPADDATPPAGTGTPPVPTPPASGDPSPNPTPPANGEPATGDPAKPADGDGTDWKARARQWESQSKANKDAASERDKLSGVLENLRKALDPDGAKDDDPATVAERAVAERDADRAELRLLKAERGAERAARKAGADVDLLLDSNGFLQRLAKLDPAADSFAADVEQAVADALAANPRLKAASTPPPPPANADLTGGGEGGTGGPQTIDQAREARRKRRAG